MKFVYLHKNSNIKHWYMELILRQALRLESYTERKYKNIF